MITNKDEEMAVMRETIGTQESLIKSYRQEESTYDLDIHGLEQRIKEKGIVNRSDLELWTKQATDYKSINRYNQNTYSQKVQTQKDKFSLIDKQLLGLVSLMLQKQ